MLISVNPSISLVTDNYHGHKFMETQELVRQLSGAYYVEHKSYYTDLPTEVLPWYVYLSDCGHNIVCILAKDYQEETELTQFLIPIPVKTVLRDYQIKNGYVVVDLPYSSEEGLLISEEDDEF
jgi:hypothetical protein